MEVQEMTREITFPKMSMLKNTAKRIPVNVQNKSGTMKVLTMLNFKVGKARMYGVVGYNEALDHNIIMFISPFDQRLEELKNTPKHHYLAYKDHTIVEIYDPALWKATQLDLVQKKLRPRFD